jgi:hypothetical protein
MSHFDIRQSTARVAPDESADLLGVEVQGGPEVRKGVREEWNGIKRFIGGSGGIFQVPR